MIHARNFARKTLVLFFLIGIGTLFSVEAHAAYKIGDDESYVKIGGLLQVHGTLEEDGAPDGESLGKELYVRRMRLMVYGQINKWVNFFVETDNPNFGKNGDLSMNTFIQDAYLELNLHPMIQVDMGMLLVPFSHHGMQGATSLLGLDYHSSLVKYPGGSTKVWRDFGFMIRGMFSKWLEYRVALFNGVHGSSGTVDVVDDTSGFNYSYLEDPRNHTDAPRLVGRLTFNIFEPEGGAGVGGMFYDGIYLKHTDTGVVSTKRVLSIGGSLDFQPNVNVIMGDIPTVAGDLQSIESRSAYLASAADLFWDIPMGAENIMSLNGQVNFYYYNYGDRRNGDNYLDLVGADTKFSTGVGISSELGFRYDAFQPIVLFDFYEATESLGDLGDVMGIHGGFNYWLFGHATSFKLQVGAAKKDGGPFGISAALQAQLLF